MGRVYKECLADWFTPTFIPHVLIHVRAVPVAHIHVSPFVTAHLPLLSLRLKKQCQVLGNQEEFMKHLYVCSPWSKAVGKMLALFSRRLYSIWKYQI